MTKIITSEDCGNSPKNILLQKLSIALATLDKKFIFKSVTDNVCWELVGNKIVQGKEAIDTELEKLQANTAEVITINHVSSHGKSGAVNGKLKLKSGKHFAFCDVYEFNNAKGDAVKEITSYIIEIE